MSSLYDNNHQVEVIEVLSSTSRYLDDLLNSDNPEVSKMVSQI